MIEPIKNDRKPLPEFETAAAEHDAAEAVKAAINGAGFTPAAPIFSAVSSDETIDEPQNDPQGDGIKEEAVSKPSAVSGKSIFLSWRWPLNRKWTIISAVIVMLLIGSGSVFAYLNQPKDMGGTFVSKRGKYVPPITTVASNLTGMQVDPAVNQRPVTGVMIENSVDARPQSGLNQAGIVFEAIAEGGITRFLALFQDSQPDYIGPVRSARPYYVQWCMSFDCALAHVGGSPEALANIPAWGTKNLDQFANAAAYHRISSRYAPHNVYSSISKLNELEASKGYSTASYTSFTRKRDTPSAAPTASSIDFAISGPLYNDHYAYDAKTDSYARSEGGATHMTVDSAGNKTQIQPKVIVALIMQYGLEADDHHSQYDVIGSGQAYVFQDGIITAATWSKADIKAPLTLTGSDNQPVALNAGQTWFTALSAANLVKYQ